MFSPERQLGNTPGEGLGREAVEQSVVELKDVQQRIAEVTRQLREQREKLQEARKETYEQEREVETQADHVYDNRRSGERSVQAIKNFATFVEEELGEEKAQPFWELGQVAAGNAELLISQIKDEIATRKEKIEEINVAVREGRMNTTPADTLVEELEQEIYALEDQEQRIANPPQPSREAEPASPDEETIVHASAESGLEDLPLHEAENRSEASDPLPEEVAAAFDEAYAQEQERQEAANAEDGPEELEGQPRKSKLRWALRRLGSWATLGYWDIHRAEQFRSARNKVAKQVARDANAIATQMEAANELDAVQQGELLEELLAEYGTTTEDLSPEQEQNLLAVARGLHQHEQQERSRELIEELVNNATLELQRRLKGYTNEYGDPVLNQENIAKFKELLERELANIVQGKTEKDLKRLRSVIQKGLDPNYWRRYVYAGALGVLSF